MRPLARELAGRGNPWGWRDERALNMMAWAQAQDRRLLAKQRGYRSLKSVSDQAVSQGMEFGANPGEPRIWAGSSRSSTWAQSTTERAPQMPDFAAESGCTASVCPLVLQSGVMAKPALDLTKLTPEEKLELIDELWTSISPEEFPLTEEQRVELHRRLDRLDEDGPTGVSWDSVRAEMMPRS